MKRSASSSSSSSQPPSKPSPYDAIYPPTTRDGEVVTARYRQGALPRNTIRRNNRPFLEKVGDKGVVFPTGVIEYDPLFPSSPHQTMIAYASHVIRGQRDFVVLGPNNVQVNGVCILSDPGKGPQCVERQQVLPRIVASARPRHPVAIRFDTIRVLNFIENTDAPNLIIDGVVKSRSFRDLLAPTTANVTVASCLANYLCVSKQICDNMGVYTIGWMWYDALLACGRAGIVLPVLPANNAHITAVHLIADNDYNPTAQITAAINGGHMHFPASAMTPQHAACMRLLTQGPAHFWAPDALPVDVPHIATFQYDTFEFFIYSDHEYQLPANVQIGADDVWSFMQALVHQHHDESAFVRGFNTAATIINGMYHSEVNPAHIQEQRDFDDAQAAQAAAAAPLQLTAEHHRALEAARDRRCNLCMYDDKEFCVHFNARRPEPLRRPTPPVVPPAPNAAALADAARREAARRAVNLAGIDRYWTSGIETGNLYVPRPHATNFTWMLTGLFPIGRSDRGLVHEAITLDGLDTAERSQVMAVIAGVYSLGVSAALHFDNLIGRELNYWAGINPGGVKNGSFVFENMLAPWRFKVTNGLRLAAGTFGAQITKGSFQADSFLGCRHGSGRGGFVALNDWSLFNGPWRYRIPYVWDVFPLVPILEGFLNLWGYTEAPASYRTDGVFIYAGIKNYDGLHLALGDSAYTRCHDTVQRREFIEYGPMFMNALRQSVHNFDVDDHWPLYYEGLEANQSKMPATGVFNAAHHLLPQYDPAIRAYLAGTFLSYSYQEDLVLALYMLKNEIPEPVCTHLYMQGILFSSGVGYDILRRTPVAPIRDDPCLAMRQRRPVPDNLVFRMDGASSNASSHLNVTGPE